MPDSILLPSVVYSKHFLYEPGSENFTNGKGVTVQGIDAVIFVS